MGAVMFVVLLAGMAVPIVLILLAVIVDMGAVVWALYRLLHDEWSARMWHGLETRVLHHRKPIAAARA
jgi:hypothetical protein